MGEILESVDYAARRQLANTFPTVLKQAKQNRLEQFA